MDFDHLVSLVGKLAWFDLATIVQLTGERRASITNQLYRLGKAGKVIHLRRGMYTLAARYRQTAVQPAALANALYRPSYLSVAWALSFYGLIPESVPVFTSVVTRTPRRFENVFGEFTYRSVKQQSLFFGYKSMLVSGQKILIATPEKALLDFWHLSRGEWTVTRMREMRFSGFELINITELRSMAKSIAMPRLIRAVVTWSQVASEDSNGVIEL